jgi:small ligand-binding sensory domain FIST
MARFGDGLAVGPDLERGAAQATRQALDRLDHQATPDLVCVFVCAEDPDDVVQVSDQVTAEVGDATVLGCSAGGVIGSGRGIELTPAVSIWAASLPHVELKGFHLDVVRTDDSLAVLGMPEVEPRDEVAVLLADPYTFPVDSFVERSNEALPGLPLVGGLATGPSGQGSTRLLLDGKVYERGAAGVVLGGSVAARTLVSQGCRPVGPAMTVTAADENILLELAGVPALDKLEEIVTELAPRDAELITRGLHVGIAMDEYAERHERGDFLVRGVVGADRERSALVIGDVVDIGQTVRFQVRDADAAEEDLSEMLARFRSRAGLDQVEGALLFSCNGRGTTLFPSADHDVRAVETGLATQGVAGFFAAGEIGPVGGRNHLHGFTASVLAFGTPVGDGHGGEREPIRG